MPLFEVLEVVFPEFSGQIFAVIFQLGPPILVPFQVPWNGAYGSLGPSPCSPGFNLLGSFFPEGVVPSSLEGPYFWVSLGRSF